MGAASVSHFETGQRAPSLESLVKLADALEVSVDTLLGRAPVEAGAMLDPIFLRASAQVPKRSKCPPRDSSVAGQTRIPLV